MTIGQLGLTIILVGLAVLVFDGVDILRRRRVEEVLRRRGVTTTGTIVKIEARWDGGDSNICVSTIQYTDAAGRGHRIETTGKGGGRGQPRCTRLGHRGQCPCTREGHRGLTNVRRGPVGYDPTSVRLPEHPYASSLDAALSTPST